MQAQQPAAKVTLAKDTFIVGDSIGVEIQLQSQAGHIYRLQKIPSLQGLEWLDSSVLHKSFTSPNIVIPVTGFDSGRFTFPQLTFAVLNAHEQQVANLTTNAFPVNITFAQVDTTQDIQPIKAPLETDYRPTPIWLYVLITNILLALAYFMYRRWRKKRNKKPAEILPPAAPVNTLTYAQEAIRQIETLRKNASAVNSHTHWFALKDILRTYLYRQYGVGTHQKTSGQIIAELRNAAVEHKDTDLLSEIFNMADMVIFAKAQTTAPEQEQGAEKAILFIKQTMPADENEKPPAQKTGK